MVFFEKIIFYMPGKFWYGKILALLSIFYFFQFLRFSGEPIIHRLVSYFFQFLCFSGEPIIHRLVGSPDVFRLRKEPINSLSSVRACVRAYVRPFRSYSLDRSIFFSDFLHQVVSPYDLDDRQKFFWSKNFLTPKMAKNGQNLAIFGQNSRF